jgi:hypothetical protein
MPALIDQQFGPQVPDDGLGQELYVFLRRFAPELGIEDEDAGSGCVVFELVREDLSTQFLGQVADDWFHAILALDGIAPPMTPSEAEAVSVEALSNG